MVALWRMARPLIMASNVIAWLLGTAIASNVVVSPDLTSLITGFVAMLLVSASVHYVNEYADYETDRLTSRTLYSGGSGVLPKGIVPRAVALHAGAVTLLLGLALQLWAAIIGVNSWSALTILLLGAAGGWMYSMPPLKLGWRGWGELLNASLGGILLPLHAYAIANWNIDPKVPLMCLPVMFLCFNNLLAVTWPDRRADAQAGKRTLATRWRTESLRRLHEIVGILSFLTLITMAGWMIPLIVVGTSLLSAPLMLWGSREYTRVTVALGSILAMATMLLAQSAAWFAIGLWT